jgi:thioredoxin-dependent peroxiredoxin
MEINKKIPAFALPDENGNPVSLEQFRGQHIVLFFYPKANTPG